MASHGKVPEFWSSAAGIEIIPDFAKVPFMQDLVDKTWRVKKTRDRTGQVPTRVRVLSVLRVENHVVYQKYLKYKSGIRKNRQGDCPYFSVETDSMRGGLDKDVNEMYLFHGTNPVAADAIARNDFDMTKAGQARGTMFGPGIYLAENASKSDEYAKEGDGIFVGQCALLLCLCTCYLLRHELLLLKIQ